MRYLKHSILAAGASFALACIPIAPAAAHGPGLWLPWGVGRGVLGAVAAVATLPLAIAAAALSIEPPRYGYEGPPAGYYPAPNYDARTPTYYATAPYDASPRHYYAPAAYYCRPTSGYDAPRAYPTGRDGYHSSYGGNASFRAAGPGYRR